VLEHGYTRLRQRTNDRQRRIEVEKVVV
jgi:hypothetical protein